MVNQIECTIDWVQISTHMVIWWPFIVSKVTCKLTWLVFYCRSPSNNNFCKGLVNNEAARCAHMHSLFWCYLSGDSRNGTWIWLCVFFQCACSKTHPDCSLDSCSSQNMCKLTEDGITVLNPHYYSSFLLVSHWLSTLSTRVNFLYEYLTQNWCTRSSTNEFHLPISRGFWSWLNLVGLVPAWSRRPSVKYSWWLFWIKGHCIEGHDR